VAGFPLTRLLNRDQIAKALNTHEGMTAFERVQRDILELFRRAFGDAPADGTLYGRQDAQWVPVQGGAGGGGVAAVTLGYDAAPDRGTVTNSAGSDATIPLYSATQAGLVPAGFEPGGAFTFGASPPASPKPGDRWAAAGEGRLYTWVDDGASAQWVEF
jgi:hypothetical protein